jgi:hypothetical protein
LLNFRGRRDRLLDFSGRFLDFGDRLLDFIGRGDRLLDFSGRLLDFGDRLLDFGEGFDARCIPLREPRAVETERAIVSRL